MNISCVVARISVHFSWILFEDRRADHLGIWLSVQSCGQRAPCTGCQGVPVFTGAPEKVIVINIIIVINIVIIIIIFIIIIITYFPAWRSCFSSILFHRDKSTSDFLAEKGSLPLS